MSKADDALMLKAPEKQHATPKLPPMRTFEVTRILAGKLPAEILTIHAHAIDFVDGAIAFQELRITDGEVMAYVSRVFKSWEDVKEVLKTDGQVH